MADTDDSKKNELAALKKNEIVLKNSAIHNIINSEWTSGGQTLLERLHEGSHAVSKASTPSDIMQGLSATDQTGKDLVAFYQQLEIILKREADRDIAKHESDKAPALSRLSTRKKSIESQEGSAAAEVGGGYAAATAGAIVADIFLGGLASLTVWALGLGAGAHAARQGVRGTKRAEP